MVKWPMESRAMERHGMEKDVVSYPWRLPVSRRVESGLDLGSVGLQAEGRVCYVSQSGLWLHGLFVLIPFPALLVLAWLRVRCLAGVDRGAGIGLDAIPPHPSSGMLDFSCIPLRTAMETAPPRPLIQVPRSLFLNTPSFCLKAPLMRSLLAVKVSTRFFHTCALWKVLPPLLQPAFLWFPLPLCSCSDPSDMDLCAPVSFGSCSGQCLSAGLSVSLQCLPPV